MKMTYAQYINYQLKWLTNYINHLADFSKKYNNAIQDLCQKSQSKEITKSDEMVKKEKEIKNSYDNAMNLYNDLKRIAERYSRKMNIEWDIRNFQTNLENTKFPIYKSATLKLKTKEHKSDGVPTGGVSNIIEPAELSMKIKNLQNEIKMLIYKISTIKNKNYESICQLILNKAEKLENSIGDFARNYNDMVNANTIGADKYFHAKANCQAAQRGYTDTTIAEFLSIFRELEEGVRKVLFEGNNLLPQIKDAKEDLKANKLGREAGKQNKTLNCKDLLQNLRPNGLDNKY